MRDSEEIYSSIRRKSLGSDTKNVVWELSRGVWLVGDSVCACLEIVLEGKKEKCFNFVLMGVNDWLLFFGPSLWW